MKSPAFQLYAADFYMDTASWPVEDVGMYTRLLFYQWVNGSIPNDIEKIARITGTLSGRKWSANVARMWSNICHKFATLPDGNLVNLRLEETRKKQLNHSEKQAKRANARWEKRNAAAYTAANATVMPDRCSSSSSSKRKEEKKKFISDEEWLKTLEDNPIYDGIEVRVLYGKMLVWCENNRKKPTRKRFVNWLNREDKPLQATGKGNGNGSKPQKQMLKSHQVPDPDREWDEICKKREGELIDGSH